MSRVTSLAEWNDKQLNRWILRAIVLLVVGTIAFVGFYVLDRYRAPTPAIIDQSLAALEQTVRDKPDDIQSRGELADTYVAKGRFNDAVAQYNAILDTGKQVELAKFGRAAAYMGLGRLDEAAADYQAVVDIAKGGEMANADPILQSAYYSLGSIAMKQARPEEAIAFLEKALAIKRSDADALYLIGTAYAAVGETDNAEIALRSAVDFVPVGWGEPYTALADTFTKAGKAAEAEWASAMADLVTGNPALAEPRLEGLVGTEAAIDAMVGLGLLHETRGDAAAAATWYEKALAKSPSNAAAQLGLKRVGPGASALPALPTPGVPAGGNG